MPSSNQPNYFKIAGLWLAPISFILIALFVKPAGLSEEGRIILAGTVWVAIWWITEAMPIAATALLPLIIFPLTGTMDSKTTASAYADDVIFLFMGGFMLATAMEKWNLHKRIALNIIVSVGADVQRIVLGFMIATAFLSMWISNTATTMMMMPIGLAIIGQTQQKDNENFSKVLMLGIAYSASIGGLGTLIGTPGNAVFAGVVKELFKQEIAFGQWMALGVPLVTLMIAITWFYLVKIAFPLENLEIEGGKATLKEKIKELGKISYEEKVVLIVFTSAAFAWITRTFLLKKFLPHINDMIIAVAGALVLFLLPTKQATDKRILDWETANKLPWGMLLLFGGGLAIAEGFQKTGLADWIGKGLTELDMLPFFMILLLVALLVNFMTEFTSNIATATLMMPVMASLARGLDVHPYSFMLAACLASSFAFMLPVATAPNAIVFGTGLIRIKDMARTGLILNLFSTLLLTLLIYYLLPWLWNLDLFKFPG